MRARIPSRSEAPLGPPRLTARNPGAARIAEPAFPLKHIKAVPAGIPVYRPGLPCHLADVVPKPMLLCFSVPTKTALVRKRASSRASSWNPIIANRPGGAAEAVEEEVS